MLSMFSAFTSQSAEIQRLRHELQYATSDTSKVWMLRDLAYYYQPVDPDSAIHYARRGVSLATMLEFPSGQIWCLYQEGLAYGTKNQLDSSFAIFEEAIRLAEESDDALSQAKLLNAVGVSHYLAGNLHDAVLYYNQGFLLSDSLHYQEGKSYALNNMAVIYRLQRRYDQALDLYGKSLDIKIVERDTVGIISGLYNKGLAFSYLDRHEESLAALLESKALADMYSGTVVDTPSITIGIGVAHYNLGNIPESRKHLEAGIAWSQNVTPEKIAAMTYLGSIDVMQGRSQQGLVRIEEAYQMTVNSGRKELLRTVLKVRASAAERADDHLLANESWKAYNLISDSLNNESNRWAMEEMQARFELLDKENTISLQQLQLEKKTAQRKWYLFSGLLLMVGLVGVVFFLRKILRQRKQLAREVARKKEALNENNLLLREMHHRTKNNLQLLNSILSLHSRNTDNDMARNALQSSRDSVGAIGLLHHQLYKTDDFRMIAFQTYVCELCDYFQKAFSLDERNISLRSQCDTFDIDIDKAIPIGLIVNEMITNAVKHAFHRRDSGTVDLHVKKEKTRITIEVKDDGIGFNDSTKQTDGVGKRLIHILSAKFKADFDYISKTEGTIARFSIPLQHDGL